MASDEETGWRGRIPADIDRPEPLVFGLTARQCLMITPALAGAWGTYLLLRDHLPWWVLTATVVPVLGVVIALALGEKGGQGLEKLAVQAARWVVAPKHLVAAPSGQVPARPRWAPRTRRAPRLEPLRLPVSAITPEGVLDLGGRCAVVIACTTLPFQLSSTRERGQVLAAFAGVLDALTAPVQILVQRRTADLGPLAEMIRANTAHLPHPALADAAHGHADFLHEMAATHELSHQQVLVVVTATGSARRAGAALVRAARDTAGRLAAIGVRTQVLDGHDAEQVLRASMASPEAPLTHDPDTGDPWADRVGDAHEQEQEW
ncbi:PrgI family protein [Nocardiopsis changdeensis]|uniref:PrgI family protein n=1 Tax=Nocardiopsis changdeensis TaxID=2831969 RepID=A0ABX8BPR8_9ACTN|nr:MULTISPECIES: PrgI family protein [Nocardiopsis]QUX24151.1 PrgI family protein [Nocardiopsis changdeensis]QYX34545.1 PrgI family protein [Nocardiopsis sp. MT53]